MFGYACDDTPELMPLPITIAQRLAQRLTEVRKDGTLGYLRPDGKTQVTIEYDEDDRPVRIDTVVLSTQHDADVEHATLEADIKQHVIDPVLATFDIPSDGYRMLVNPTGTFVIGGPMGDAGLTGRKIIVDTYGGMARHGGGAFSGKDPSKVDRSAAYAMRWVAKNVVAAGLARRCEAQVAYAIGKAAPVGVFIETFGTGVVTDEKIQQAVLEVFDLRPAAIIRDLDLLRPIYAQTSAYGHFGRELPEFTWETHRPRRQAEGRRRHLSSHRDTARPLTDEGCPCIWGIIRRDGGSCLRRRPVHASRAPWGLRASTREEPDDAAQEDDDRARGRRRVAGGQAAVRGRRPAATPGPGPVPARRGRHRRAATSSATPKGSSTSSAPRPAARS